MILSILSLLLFLVFLFLGGIHFYWLYGGTWGLKNVIPTKENEENFPPIPQIATLFVALGLTFFGFLYLAKSSFLEFSFLENYYGLSNFAYWFIPSLFIIRAIGDFNYLGLFKKIKNTDFAKADSNYFVPLCLGIGFIGMIINFNI